MLRRARLLLLPAATVLLLASCALPVREPGRRGPDLLHRWELGVARVGAVGVAGRILNRRGEDFPIEARFGAGRYILEYRDDATDSILEALGDAQAWDLFGVEPAVDSRVFLGESEDGIQTWQYVVEPGYSYRARFADRPLRMIARDVFDDRGRLVARFRSSDFFGLSPSLFVPRTIDVLAPGGNTLLALRAARISSEPPIAAPRIRPVRPLSEAVLDAEAFNILWKNYHDARPASEGDLTIEESRRFAAAVIALVEAVHRVDSSQAREILSSSIAYDRTNADLARLAVQLARSDDDDSGAIFAAERYARAVPEDTAAWLAVGSLIEDLDRLDEAELFYDTMIARFPAEPDFRLQLGSLLFNRKKWIEGEEVFDALDAFLDDSGFLPDRRARYDNGMAAVYAEANIALAKARRLNEYALTVDRDNPFYLDTLGVLLWRDGQRSAALATFQRALARKDHPMIRGHMARAQERR